MAELKTWYDLGIDPGNITGAHKYIVCPKCSPYRKQRNQKQKTLGLKFGNIGSFGCIHCGFSGSLAKGILNEGNPNQFAKGDKNFVVKEYIKPEFKPVQFSSESSSEKFYRYFAERGISKETVVRNNISPGMTWFSSIGDNGKNWPSIDFPFYKFGEVVNIKHRSFDAPDGERHFTQESNAEKVVYGFDDIQPLFDGNNFCYFSEIIIVEGEPDKLSWEEIGKLNCISVPDGAPHPSTKEYTSKFDFLDSIMHILEKADNVILAVDNDVAGIRLMEELANRIGKEKCSLVIYPDKCKDSNDVLKTHGKEGLRKVYESKYKMPLDGIVEKIQFDSQVRIITEIGIETGVPLPWSALSHLFKMSFGETLFLHGFPGTGKSVLSDNMLLRYCKLLNIKAAMFSPEHDLKVNIARMIQIFIGKPIRRKIPNSIAVQDFINYATEREIAEAANWIQNNIYFIERERGKQANLSWLHEKKKMLINRYGVKFFLDDPYNRLAHNRKKDQGLDEYIGEFAETYEDFNKRNDVFSILCMHPKTIEPDPKTGLYPKPSVSYIHGGSMWWNRGSNIGATDRNGMESSTKESDGKPTTFIMQKVKLDWNGEKGAGNIYYNPLNNVFYSDKERKNSEGFCSCETVPF